MPLELPSSLSPSKVSAFQDCALAFRFSAIDRLPEPPSTAQVRGSVVHAALEQLYALPAIDRVPETALSLVTPAWDAVVAEKPELAEEIAPELRETLLKEARDLLAGYYRMEDPTRFDPLPMVIAAVTHATPGALPGRTTVTLVEPRP